jgi:kinesin family protein 5
MQEMLQAEIRTVTEQAESRAAEIKRLQSTIESYKLSNEELNVGCPLPHQPYVPG